MEENRGLMGKKRFSNVHIAGESLIGISNSNTTRMLRHSTELFRYCADGLAGWSPISSPPFINILAELRLTFSFILQFVLNCALRFTYIASTYYKIDEHSLHMGCSLM